MLACPAGQTGHCCTFIWPRMSFQDAALREAHMLEEVRKSCDRLFHAGCPVEGPTGQQLLVQKVPS